MCGPAAKSRKETFWADENVPDFYFDGGYSGVYIFIKIPSRVPLIWAYFIICKLYLDKDAKNPYISGVSIHLGSCCRSEG